LGDAFGAHNLGAVFLQGLGVNKNGREAVRWFDQAGSRGYVDSISNLAVMYMFGQEIPEDRRRAYLYGELCADLASSPETIRQCADLRDSAATALNPQDREKLRFAAAEWISRLDVAESENPTESVMEPLSGIWKRLGIQDYDDGKPTGLR
jgi:TPR repeat protein